MAVKHARLHGHFARSIKLLSQEEGTRKKDVEDQLVEVCLVSSVSVALCNVVLCVVTGQAELGSLCKKQTAVVITAFSWKVPTFLGVLLLTPHIW